MEQRIATLEQHIATLRAIEVAFPEMVRTEDLGGVDNAVVSLSYPYANMLLTMIYLDVHD
jgi:hypothetical protein